MKKYNIILADPPWTYRDKAKAGNRGVEFKYPCMSVEEIRGLQIPNISADDCVLFLWCPAPHLPVAIEIIPAWGFQYKTMAFTWVKRNKKADSWFWGMGRWTRSNPEYCLLCTKGEPKRISAGVHSVVDTHLEKHSKKPDEVRSRIVKLMGDIPRIELFARQKAEGWDVWGNEVESDVNI